MIGDYDGPHYPAADVAPKEVLRTLSVVTATGMQDEFASLENNVLRGMDAIHIASALALQVDVFVSADVRQCDAAANAGLTVDRLGAV